MQKIRPDLDIGGNIQQMRYQNKLTQDQVIARLNLMGIPISKSTYAKLETNRMNIKVSELLALSQIFFSCSPFRTFYFPTQTHHRIPGNTTDNFSIHKQKNTASHF